MTHLDPDHAAALILLGPSLLGVAVIGIACGIEALRSYAARQQRRRARRR